jgi:ubiquinone/menaquinone biosynthesis C-methylase UbiE
VGIVCSVSLGSLMHRRGGEYKIDINVIDSYREDEIQVLIVLAELTEPVETPNNNFYRFYPKNMEEARTYFRRFAVDLSAAFQTLATKGFLHKKSDEWLLTPKGRAIAGDFRRLRPPIWYWYKDFYIAIESSQAYSEYCRLVFGKDLGQHGFSDINQIHRMLKIVKPDETSQVLDIGCGNGKIAEYISDLTQASVTGVDYISEAIDQALKRTKDKRNRLHFEIGNIETLDFREELFDIILSIDSIFFGRDLKKTLAGLRKITKPDGQMAIFCEEDLSSALRENGLAYKVYDFSEEHHAHMQLKRRVASEMREAFEDEGSAFIWENLMRESIASPEPYNRDTSSISRYLYHVRRG